MKETNTFSNEIEETNSSNISKSNDSKSVNTLAVRLDTYFCQDDSHGDYSAVSHDYQSTDDKDLTIDETSTNKSKQLINYKWSLHYSVSYWSIISLLFADTIMLVSSSTSLYKINNHIHYHDYYALFTINNFVGMLFYCIGGYCSIFQVINDIGSPRHTRYCICFRDKKTKSFWALLTILSAS
eukprot:340677_1